MKNRYFAWLLLPLLLAGCVSETEQAENATVEGYRPIYLTAAEAATVEVKPARSLQTPGKIYRYQSLLFINELGKGVHVFNNADPASPQALAFLSIPGNADVAIRNGYLYADNLADLIVLDVRNINAITVVRRVPNVFPVRNVYPNERGIKIECPDPARGTIIGWEKTTLRNPRCSR